MPKNSSLMYEFEFLQQSRYALESFPLDIQQSYDASSWKNGFMSPVLRTDYPLLFDRNFQAKPFIQEIIDNAK